MASQPRVHPRLVLKAANPPTTEFHIGDETPKTTSSLENLRRTTDCHVKPLNRKHLGLNFNGRFYENIVSDMTQYEMLF